MKILSFPPTLLVSHNSCYSTLAPLIEGSDPAASEPGETKRTGSGTGQWMKGHLSRAPSLTSSVAYKQRSDLRLLLGVTGAPLAPVNVFVTHHPHTALTLSITPPTALTQTEESANWLSRFSISSMSFGLDIFLDLFRLVSS
ncbi:hypothetical protein LXL04_020672 [Taraxacum kok-saghyz]